MSMAASADHYHLPSKEEIGTIQSEIIALENEVMDVHKVIEQARLRLDELTRQLNERKSRIAPVRKASFDVLSSIFEHCSEIDWMSPLRIGGVSRLWRETILHTPRAWCFIDMSNLDAACINAYFERSGQRGLHVALAHPDEVELFAPVAHRIQCLAFPFLSGPLEALTFPRLTRLRSAPSHNAGQFSDTAMITPSGFPNLRHLELRNILLEANSCEELWSLQTLKIRVFDNDGWSELLRACKGTLVSLQITCPDGGYLSQELQVELPNLRYLKVSDEAQEDCSWASFLVTPALQVYWEESECFKAEESRERTESITHLRLQRVPSMFPMQLRVLQLDISIEEFRSLISDLKSRPSSCLHLEILEFGRSYVTSHELVEIEKTLGECNWQPRPGLVRPPTITAKWSVSLPDEIKVEVRDLYMFESD
jgi:hypothetical protein